MNEFCEMKGIRREFSVARTPQQNSVAERKNRTLVEAARTMLADSKLPTTFYAEAVNTACYVQNRVLVIKPHNKTPYELFLGRKHALSFMRPFGYPVTILNTLDHLGDGVQDPIKEGDNNDQEKDLRDQEEAFRKQCGQEFERLFSQGDAANTNSTNKLNIVSLPVNVVSSSFTTVDPGRERAQRNEFESMFGQDQDANGNKMFTPISVAGSTYVNLGGSITINVATLPNVDFPTYLLMLDLEDTADLLDTGIFSGAYDDKVKCAVADFNNLEFSTVVSPIPTTRIHKDHPKEQIIGDPLLAPQTKRMTKTSQEHAMMDVKSAFLYGTIEEEVYVCQPPILEDPHFPDKVYKVEKALYGLHQAPRAWCSHFPDKVYKVEKALYGLHQAPRAWYETLSTYLLENRFRRGTIDKILFIKNDKEFEGLMHKKFQISSMGELTFFLGLQVMQRDDGVFISQGKYVADILKKFDFYLVKIESTLIETNKAFLKDEEAEDVDVHLYKSMTGSLMYLTASRLNIMFVVYSCARFQVTHIVSHIHDVKRIFRYLNGQPKLGLWYPKDSSFDFFHIVIMLELVLIGNPKQEKTWELSKQGSRSAIIHLVVGCLILLRNRTTHTFRSRTELELFQFILIDFMACFRDLLNRTLTLKITCSCLNDVDEELKDLAMCDLSYDALCTHWLSLKGVTLLCLVSRFIDKKKVIISEASIRRDLRFKDERGVDCLSNEVIFEQLTLIGGIMASAIICLATNQNFNFSKYIFDNMVKQLDGGVKFLMYPIFVQVFLDNQVEGMDRHNLIFVTSSHTKKVFANMKREGKDFSRIVTPLFQSMMVQAPEDIAIMASLADKAILSGAENRPPMLEKDMYDSWRSRTEMYMLNRQHGRIILESVEHGPLLWPSVTEEGVTRLKKYSELSAAEAIQADCDETVALESNMKPRNNVRKLYERLRKIYKWSYIKFTPSGYMWKPKSPTGNVNMNVRAVTIKRVYYCEGLNHNLFSVGQFYDAELEVAFRKSTCFIRDLKGNDLLT
nr:hypothetical protein [Tanacetum cinerariifolium]